jgi:hypothetical protein
MKPVQFAPIKVHPHDSFQSMWAQGPALKQFASKQKRERPLLIAGSLVALGVIPMAAYASRRVFGRPHVLPVVEIELPRNMEWYPWE